MSFPLAYIMKGNCLAFMVVWSLEGMTHFDEPGPCQLLPCFCSISVKSSRAQLSCQCLHHHDVNQGGHFCSEWAQVPSCVFYFLVTHFLFGHKHEAWVPSPFLDVLVHSFGPNTCICHSWKVMVCWQGRSFHFFQVPFQLCPLLLSEVKNCVLIVSNKSAREGAAYFHKCLLLILLMEKLYLQKCPTEFQNAEILAS